MNPQKSIPMPNEIHDVIVIGAGVVGCAMARRFALEGAKVVVVEKAGDILDGASKGNSAILHTGFDEVTGSIEHQCVTAGYQEFMDIHEKLNLPVLKTGALVIAWSSEQADRLEGLQDKSIANGVTSVKRLTSKQISEREPHLSEAQSGGIQIPTEYVIDPWTTPYSYLLQAMAHGAKLSRNTEVLAGEFDGDHWRLETSAGPLIAVTVINCAGLYGDRIDAALIQKSDFDIRPRKGQFLVYDKAASKLVNSIILPVPTKTTKGVVVCRTVFGNLLVGPTADEQESRDDTSVDTASLNFLRKTGEGIVPALANYAVTATYAGIRPATQNQDYCIRPYPDKNYISVGGIRSTGLSGALGIATYVFKHYAGMGNSHMPVENPAWPAPIQISEQSDRDWAKPGNGGIICHCELVTRREVEAALSGPLAASCLAALKRRTRVTMGRCQGFYCSGHLSKITAGHFDQPIGVQDDAE
ncbi:putative dehydrogenase [Hoeflea sp. IMCC20628]|uniref:NAD(P)/FAD-dependent oxidoreductase n=1 Tax=Hoeflea sp. IMCC20628 TaxID=1620421 RepID=UPI00063BF2C0|nr:NAD(P)/FAD-dependent oxidoreductase [Hoeflea sp. IMCC20628]AKI00535.1 putative dehydrogenase [Hoeflea sp. IMCC20628]